MDVRPFIGDLTNIGTVWKVKIAKNELRKDKQPDSHMAPYGASEVVQKQRGAVHSSKQSDFGRDRAGKLKALPNAIKLARAATSSAQWLRSTPEPRHRAPSSCRARTRSDVERYVRINNVGAMFSSAVQ